ncbi:MAG: NTP transferase domain-containing protein [Gemmatimonadota bacterium]
MSIVGVIPCAGRSTRMGTSKALLRAGGDTFLGAAVRLLREGGCDEVRVVHRAEQADEARVARDAGAATVVNPHPEEGPITSLRTALAGAGPDWEAVVFLPVDHPRVRPDTVAGLIAAFRRTGAPLVVPAYAGRRGHPPLFATALFGELTHPELEGGARTVVRRHAQEAVLLEVDDPGVLMDVDTPEDFTRAFAAGDDAPADPTPERRGRPLPS